MAKAIAYMSPDYTKMMDAVQEYLSKLGDTEYKQENFAWFRPPEVTDGTDLKQIHSPFSLDDLSDQSSKLLEDGNVEKGNSGDWSIIQLQSDLITMVNRVHSERHRPKLRSFAHAAATCNGTAGSSGVLSCGITDVIKDVNFRANL
jgi:hypothetical protein